MPNITIPVRMTTAMLFFVTGGVAAYFAIDKSDIEWFVQVCFLFFVALGPIYWVQEWILELPWKDDHRYTEGLRYINDTAVGKGITWVVSTGRLGLIAGACWLIGVAVF